MHSMQYYPLGSSAREAGRKGRLEEAARGCGAALPASCLDFLKMKRYLNLNICAASERKIQKMIRNQTRGGR